MEETATFINLIEGFKTLNDFPTGFVRSLKSGKVYKLTMVFLGRVEGIDQDGIRHFLKEEDIEPVTEPADWNINYGH